MNIPKPNDFGERLLEARDKSSDICDLLDRVYNVREYHELDYLITLGKDPDLIIKPNGCLTLDVIVKMLEERRWKYVDGGFCERGWYCSNEKPYCGHVANKHLQDAFREACTKSNHPFDWFAAADALIKSIKDENAENA